MTNNPKPPLIERKTRLYNRISKEIDWLAPSIKRGASIKHLQTTLNVLRAIQRLLDEIFYSDEEV